jgi:hypothetical protein
MDEMDECSIDEGFMDEIGSIEAAALQQTEVGNWPSARRLFLRALTLEMPPLRRAYIEKSVALTHQREANWREALMWANMALDTLGSVGILSGGDDAQSLYQWLSRFVQDMSSQY